MRSVDPCCRNLADLPGFCNLGQNSNGHRVSRCFEVDSWNKVLCHAMSTTAEGAGRRGSFREGHKEPETFPHVFCLKVVPRNVLLSP